jgi:hypothetical protein
MWGGINYDGTLGTDTITVTGPDGVYSETFNPNSGTNDQLVYDNNLAAPGNVVFTLNYTGAETVNDNIQTTNLTINSSGATDNVQLGDNVFGSDLAEVQVNYQAGDKTNITVNGQGQSSVEITGAVNISGELAVNADTMTEMNAGASITAGTLTLNSVRIAGTGVDGLTTDISNLNITNHTGDVYIDELDTNSTDGITIAAMSGTAGSINITTAINSISSSADLQYAGALNLNSAADIDLSGINTFSGPVTLNAANDINLTSVQNNLSGALDLTAANITLNNSVATNLSAVSAQNLTLVSNGDVIDSGVIDVQNAGAGLANITSSTGSVTLTGGDDDIDIINISAANDATIDDVDGIAVDATNVGGALQVTTGNADTTNDLLVGSVTADSITLDATDGGIFEIASNASDVTANQINLYAVDGIGGGSGVNYEVGDDFNNIDSTGAIRTRTASLTAENINTTPGSGGVINIVNDRDVTINGLRNNNDIVFQTQGDIELFDSTVGTIIGEGAIDAHYGGNVDDTVYYGSVAIQSTNNGNLTTTGVGPAPADITAENLYVAGVTDFGTESQPIRLRVNNHFALVASQGAVTYVGNPPQIITTPADFVLLVVQGVTGLSNQQLIDLETLGEVDPAIFTEVRNYNYDDIAIMLPADQRYTTPDEDEEEEKKKKQL